MSYQRYITVAGNGSAGNSRPGELWILVGLKYTLKYSGRDRGIEAAANILLACIIRR